MRQSAWKIDRDLLAEEFGDEPQLAEGPSDRSESAAHTLNTTNLGYRFRLLDDDGEVYYIGRTMFRTVKNGVQTTPTNAEAEEVFGPLWDFGEPNAGCTEIQYWLGRGIDRQAGWVTI
jgi:hypothetical protein